MSRTSIAAVAGGAPTGPAARAALRIRRESLLRVVLLIGRGVDEVDSTVDAGDRPISVGHGAPPGRVVGVVRLRRAAASAVGKARGLAQEAGPQRPRCRCGVPVAGRTGSLVRRRIQRVFESDIARPARPSRATASRPERPRIGTAAAARAGPMTTPRMDRPGLASVTTYLSQWRASIRVGERGVMGAPRSRHTQSGAPGPRSPDRHQEEARPERMLRIIHTADVHLGARHDDLGEQASAQRERQFAAFVATIDLAIAEKVDLVLIAGDLFDSNVQPRRSVERVAAQLKRLVAAKIRIGDPARDARRVRPRRRSIGRTTSRPSPAARRTTTGSRS